MQTIDRSDAPATADGLEAALARNLLPAWAEHAAFRGVDPEVFYADGAGDAAAR